MTLNPATLKALEDLLDVKHPAPMRSPTWNEVAQLMAPLLHCIRDLDRQLGELQAKITTYVANNPPKE